MLESLLRSLGFLLIVASASAACSGNNDGFDVGTGGDGGLLDGAVRDAADAGNPSDSGAVDIVTSPCTGTMPSRISGIALAPNGHDPLPNVLVYATADDRTFPPLATSVTCQHCVNPPAALAYAQSGTDGSFTLEARALDEGGTFTVVFESGSFRHVQRHVSVGRCGTVAMTAAQTKLPGANAGEDTIPRIAIAGYRTGGTRATDVNDKFTLVLNAIGITGYDAVDPDRSGHNGGSGMDLIGLLSNMSMLSTYQILITPCGSLGNFTVAANLTPAMLTNLRAWLAAGGRLYASDLAYSVIDRGAPGVITFATGATMGDPADVGVGLATGASLTATVDDARLRTWLQQVSVIPGSGTTIPIADLRDPWGAMDQVPASELTGMMGSPPAGTVLVSGDVGWHVGPTGAHHHPLTVQVDYPGAMGGYCGRIVFTSYHVQSTTTGTALSAQERVLEYLFFQLSTCIETPG